MYPILSLGTALPSFSDTGAKRPPRTPPVVHYRRGHEMLQRKCRQPCSDVHRGAQGRRLRCLYRSLLSIREQRKAKGHTCFDAQPPDSGSMSRGKRLVIRPRPGVERLDVAPLLYWSSALSLLYGPPALILAAVQRASTGGEWFCKLSRGKIHAPKIHLDASCTVTFTCLAPRLLLCCRFSSLPALRPPSRFLSLFVGLFLSQGFPFCNSLYLGSETNAGPPVRPSFSQLWVGLR